MERIKSCLSQWLQPKVPRPAPNEEAIQQVITL